MVDSSSIEYKRYIVKKKEALRRKILRNVLRLRNFSRTNQSETLVDVLSVDRGVSGRVAETVSKDLALLIRPRNGRKTADILTLVPLISGGKRPHKLATCSERRFGDRNRWWPDHVSDSKFGVVIPLRQLRRPRPQDLSHNISTKVSYLSEILSSLKAQSFSA